MTVSERSNGASAVAVPSVEPPADDDVEWALIADEAVHPVAGFTSVLELRYLAHLHKTISAVIVVNTLYCSFSPLLLLLGLRTVELDEGWEETGFLLVSIPVVVTLIIAMAINALANKNELQQARVHDTLASIAMAVVVIWISTAEFEGDNECARLWKRNHPDASDADVRARCATDFSASVYIVFMECVATNLRLPVVYPALAGGFAGACLSLLFLTHATIMSEVQTAVRCVILLSVSLAIAAVVYAIDKTNRSSFLLTKTVVRLTEEAKDTSKHINGLLEAMLPASVLTRLAAGEDRIFDVAKVATVSFSDIAGFTNWSAERSSQEVVQLVSTLVSAYDLSAKECKVSKVKTIGDAYWAISGLPEPTAECAARICNFGLRQQELLVGLNEKNPQWNGIELRVGCHTGRLVGGIIGTQQLAYEVFGETNDVAQKHEQLAPHGGVLVSQSTADAARSSDILRFLVHAGIEIHGHATYLVTRSSAPRLGHGHGSLRALTTNGTTDATLNRRDDRANVMRVLGLGKRGGQSTDASSRRSLGSAVNSARGTPMHRAVNMQTNSFGAVEEVSFGDAPGVVYVTGAADVSDAAGDEEPDIEMTRVGCAHKFTNPNTEEEFYAFDHVAKYDIRQVANVCNGGAGLVWMMCVLIELPPPRYGEAAASMVIFALCGACFLGMAAVSRLKADLSRAQGRAIYFLGYALCSGYGLAIELLPQDLIVIDPWCMTAICMPMLYVSPPADVWLVFHLLATLCFAVSYFLAGVRSAVEDGTIVVLAMVMAAVWFGVVQNSRDRAKFKTKKLADGAGAVVAAEGELQHQILASMAPAHVQRDMVALVTSAAFKAGEPVSISHTLSNVTVCFVTIDTHGQLDDSPHAYDDISGNHERVEACLAKYPAGTKIKSVGNMIVVAGPLDVDATAEDAAAAAKDIFSFAYDVTHKFRGHDESRVLGLRAGVCSGPVVACVMGTDRLAYDIFGNTVNTASRCMTTAQPGTMQSLVAQQQLYGDHKRGPGDVATVVMKGKGDVGVYRS
jgi:class 3 adenylate cyclase